MDNTSKLAIFVVDPFHQATTGRLVNIQENSQRNDKT